MTGISRPAAFLAALLASTCITAVTPAAAQSARDLVRGERMNDPDAQLVLAADEVIYDNDAQTVTARGAVQLEYNGYNLVARSVTYDRANRRVLAQGAVEIIEPDGNRLYAERIDITDDFADGFVDALTVETIEDARFAAESAERLPNDRTVFNSGVYTACKRCEENPSRPPTWSIKAERVVLDGETRTVEYRNASFELFGRPIAYLPYFRHPDPSVKRKSGFLFPTFGYTSDLGVSVGNAYFWALTPSSDVTIAATGFSNQGVLADVEYRQQLETGLYTLRAAGIVQQGRERFETAPDTEVTGRGALATTGRFAINDRWTFGWNGLLQSDKTFARTYDLDGYDSVEIDNEIYLRGKGDRSWFDLSAYQFLIQAPPERQVPNFEYFQDEQPIVHPVLDYQKIRYSDGLGGELKVDVNVQSVSRERTSVVEICNSVVTNAALGCPAGDLIDVRTHGIDGHSTRASMDVEAKKRLDLGGLSFTTTASLRGDYTYVEGFGSPNSPDVQQNSTARVLSTLGFEARYPLLVQTETTSHVIEPIAQLFIRPDVDDPTLPNEDAQSLVFDATTLFQRDKFSGYDRLETGTRANLGVRYSGAFANGLNIDAVFGQSFHLAGRNPYARRDDLINVGEASGLENSRSDYVAGFGIANGGPFRFDALGRFDESDFSTERLGLTATYASVPLSASTSYTYISAQPAYGFPETRQEIAAAFDVKLTEYWRAQASATFDIDAARLISDSIGLSYADDCFTFSIAFAEVHDRYNTAVEADRSVTFRLSFRTLGDFGTTIDPGQTSLLD